MGARRAGTVLAALIAGAVMLGGCGDAAPRSVPLLARTIAALDAVKSFHLHAVERRSGADTTTVDAEIVLPGRITLTVTTGSAAASMVAIGSDAYVSGNAMFWADLGTSANALHALSGRWIRYPAARLAVMRPLLALTHAATVGHCLLGNDGDAARVAGAAGPAGRSAITLAYPGTRPGETPAQLLVSATAAPLPLRLTETGAVTPGGRPDPICGRSTTPVPAATSDISFSGFNASGAIFAPAPVFSKDQLLAGPLAALRRAQRAPAATRTEEQTQARTIVGEWIGHGVVTASDGLAGESPGGTLTRLWRITGGCGGGACNLYIRRTTVSGTSGAPLLWVGHHWTAHFVQSTGCIPSGAAILYSDWVLTLNGTRLTAVEHNHTDDRCGPSATSDLAWSARRAPAPPGTVASA